MMQRDGGEVFIVNKRDAKGRLALIPRPDGVRKIRASGPGPANALGTRATALCKSLIDI